MIERIKLILTLFITTRKIEFPANSENELWLRNKRFQIKNTESFILYFDPSFMNYIMYRKNNDS